MFKCLIMISEFQWKKISHVKHIYCMYIKVVHQFLRSQGQIPALISKVIIEKSRGEVFLVEQDTIENVS